MFLISVEWLDEAKTRARFSLPGRTEWRAEHVDALIHALEEIREGMSPPVSAEPPRLQELEPLHDPRYASELHRFSGGTLISFRHPALGWLPFLLPSWQRRTLAESLGEQEAAWSEFRVFGKY
jgi:hypothetical protein